MASAHRRVLELGTDALPALLDACKTAGPQGQMLASSAALEIDEEKGLDAMEMLITAEDREVRKSVVLSLSQTRSENPRIPQLLGRFADDPDADLRATAANHLYRFPGEETKKVLERFAQDGDELTARHAARNLKDMTRNQPGKRRR